MIVSCFKLVNPPPWRPPPSKSSSRASKTRTSLRPTASRHTPRCKGCTSSLTPTPRPSLPTSDASPLATYAPPSPPPSMPPYRPQDSSPLSIPAQRPSSWPARPALKQRPSGTPTMQQRSPLTPSRTLTARCVNNFLARSTTRSSESSTSRTAGTADPARWICRPTFTQRTLSYLTPTG